MERSTIMHLTVIADDFCPNARLRGEHGLSFFIETPRGNILFDTGAGGSILHNMKELRVEPDNIDNIVLSHGHCDHTGGLIPLLQRNSRIPVWAESNFDTIRYSLKGGRRRYNGNLYPRQAMEFHAIENGMEIIDNVTAVRVPVSRRENRYIPLAKELVTLNSQGRYEKDLFKDDISLLVKGRYGYSVILGCAHSGIYNILNEIKRICGLESFYAVIGGMHLKSQTIDFISNTASAIASSFTIQKWFPNHCTGIEALIPMSEYLDNIHWASSGMKIEI
jgi:7,8-dihydropterin-6-yl-methyl-4-(beta-D-ribofuranosyl)aminobenzene 5'-phosphate synthase